MGILSFDKMRHKRAALGNGQVEQVCWSLPTLWTLSPVLPQNSESTASHFVRGYS